MNYPTWQLISRDKNLFNILRGEQTHLSTVELPITASMIRMGFANMLDDYRYESCLFTANDDSDVLARYTSRQEAIAGHKALSKKYGLT